MRVEFSPAGHTPTSLQTGDLLFLHRHGPVRRIIFLGQWLRASNRPWALLTHVACVVEDGWLVEATVPRVRRLRLDHYQLQEYVVCRTSMDHHDQEQARHYLLEQVGEPYGYLTILGISLRMLTPSRLGLFLGLSSTAICSGLGASMLERGWYVFRQAAATLAPAELARELGVHPYAQ